MDMVLADRTPAAAAAIRPLRPGDPFDDHGIRRVWRQTVALGSPLSASLLEQDGPGMHVLAGYERLSLDWYLDPANLAAGSADGVVAEQDGMVRGYLLACLDQHAFDRWVTRAALRWAATATTRLPRLGPDGRRFVRLRLRDGLHAWRHQVAPPFPAHMHFNLEPCSRAAFLGHRLISWMDGRTEQAGLPGYFGEMNFPEGQSLRAIEAGGGRVVGRIPNRTFSWLLGTPVDRCIVARDLAERTSTVPRYG